MILKMLMLVVQLPFFILSSAQIKNAITETAMVYGNCAMCERTIEKAGNLKNVSKVDWNVDTKMASLTYDSKKTTQDEILKRIALVGYDNDEFLAPGHTYTALPACCQYDRAKEAIDINMEENMATNSAKSEMPNIDMAPNENIDNTPKEREMANPLITIYTSYFEVKDALTETDGPLTAIKASALLVAINAVKMETLAMDVHMIWMKIVNDLKQDVNAMAATEDVEAQRSHFINLSKNMHDLIKVTGYEAPVYYQFCPMANGGKGANWLSKEDQIKNPYYGSKMLSCGKVVETIE